MWFFTATINSWKHLLNSDEIKQIVVDSLYWHCLENRALVHGFVIMPNHIHLLWSSTENQEHYQNGVSLLKQTGHDFKVFLQLHQPALLKEFRSSQSDRIFHFWERRALSRAVVSRDIAWQKLSYIHRNPVHEKWKLSQYQEDYKYSSAAFYAGLSNPFPFLTHFMDYI